MAALLGFFELYINLKWDSFLFLCFFYLDWSTFHKTLKTKYWSSTMYGPPSPHRPCYSFWSFCVIFHLKHVKCRGKLCDVWPLTSFQSAPCGKNQHYDSYLCSNMFFTLVFVILSTVYCFSHRLSPVSLLKAGLHRELCFGSISYHVSFLIRLQ